MLSYIVLAIPVFFLLIGIELVAVKATGKRYYRLADAINNMSTGIIDQVLLALSNALILFTLYIYLYEHLAITHLNERSPLTWVIAFIGVDFFYYWWHRYSHEVNFMWAAHVVHHQSQEYNLTVALRQNWLAGFFSRAFDIPLALMGVPPLIFLVMKEFMILYQFWIHTRFIGNMGKAELILNTPSHHRVHHGINPQYVDKNYAGTFIIWDRLFGTFEPEGEEVLYGTLKPINSLNPIWANFHSWIETFKVARAAHRWRDRLWVWFAHPGWAPGANGVDLETLFNEVKTSKYRPTVSRRRGLYVLTQFLITLLSAAALLFGQGNVTKPQLASAVGFILLSLYSHGALLEKKRFAVELEATRLALVFGVLGYCLVHLHS